MRPRSKLPAIAKASFVSVVPILGLTADLAMKEATTGLGNREAHGNTFNGLHDQFMNYGDWFGLNGRTELEMKAKNVTLKAMIDYYLDEKWTTLGQFPFTILFLNETRRMYGIQSQDIDLLEGDIKAGVGGGLYTLLVDTINMVMTGKRELRLPFLKGYLDSYSDMSNLKVTERFDRKEVAKLTNKEFLSKWLSTEKGMWDCVEVHRMLFRINS